MKHLSTLAFLLLFAIPAASGSSQRDAQDVNVCRLSQNARQFDGQRVRVRGMVSLEFENFTISEGKCVDSAPGGIWLTFGGDFSDIAVYCCGDHSRMPGRTLRIQGHSISLKKDREFRWFVEALQASRNRMPSGEPCEYGLCNFYRVTGALIGVFYAKSDSVGYGHLGCCNLLAIEEVKDVNVERTAIPAGGQFKCRSDVWRLQLEQAEALGLSTRCLSISNHESCEADTHAVVNRIASHWDEKIDASKGSTQDHGGPLGEELLTWISDDLLTNFTMHSGGADPEKVMIAREVCEPMPGLAPEQTSKPISCEEHLLSARDHWSISRRRLFDELLDKGQFKAAERLNVESAERLSVSGEESWRTQESSKAAFYVLNEQLKKWRVTLSPYLQFEKCVEDAPLEEQEYAYTNCSWSSADATQAFDINLMRRRVESADQEKRLWLLVSISARTCGLAAFPISTSPISAQN